MEPGGFEHEPVASRIDVARVVPAWIDAAEMDEIIAREQTAIKNTTASAWAATRRDAINALLATAEWSGKTIDDLFAFAQRDVTTWERGVRSLRESLPTSYDDIRAAAGEQLGRWLPDWEAPATTVSFGLYRRADFRIDDDTIYVDLGRLGQAVDPQGTLRQGLSHELVHRWFHEVLPGSTDPHTYLREKVVNEGLAMFVAEQSLADHHRQTPEQYAETSARAIATPSRIVGSPVSTSPEMRTHEPSVRPPQRAPVGSKP